MQQLTHSMVKTEKNMAEDIAIVGAGGFGREISLLIDLINKNTVKFNKVGFYDDGIPAGTKFGDLQVLGKVDELNRIKSHLNVVVAISNPEIKKSINQRLTNKLLIYPNIIHPELKLNEGRNKIGIGNIFTEGFIMTCDITIGNFNIFNTRVSLGHDVKIGNFNVFNPNTQISGDVTIMDANLFGVNSCVLQGMSIGSCNMLGAYSLLTRRIRNGKKYFGIPSKLMRE
jgi:sugar O-acyltransferase (sialic acid O-acetyltransferase NeuD family)